MGGSASLLLSVQYLSEWTSEASLSQLFVSAEDEAADPELYLWKGKNYTNQVFMNSSNGFVEEYFDDEHCNR